jgi:hypothetical protein
MGIPQTIEAPVTCSACRQEVLAEVDIMTPLPYPSAPLKLSVGDSLAPFTVPLYDRTFVRLRQRKDPERGRVLADFICPVCRAPHWAVVELGPLDGEPSVVSVEARPIAPKTLDEADWIYPTLITDLRRGSGVSLPDEGELTPEELEMLKNLVPKPGAPYPP